MSGSHSVELQDGSRISTLCKNGQLITNYFDDVRTIYEGFQRGLRIENGKRPCLGARSNGGVSGPYHYLTYAEVYSDAHKLGSAFIKKIGLAPGQKTFMGIYSRNSVQWTIMDLACEMFSMPTVPLYDTLGKEAQLFIVNQAEIQLVLCDDLKRTENLVKEADKMKSLKHIVVTFSDVPEALIQQAHAGKVEIHQYDDLLKHGQKCLVDAQLPKPSDIFTICYTSGTTGMPKGVILTHASMTSMISALLLLEGNLHLLEQSTNMAVLSYLPLAHVLERALESLVLCMGGKIGYFSGDVRNMASDAQEVRPTIFACVPRVANKLVDRIRGAVDESNCLKQCIFKRAVDSKTELLRSGKITQSTIWDALVFKKVRDLLGGQIRLIVCGSAPIHPTVLDFMRIAFGCPVVEGYGQTETSAVISASSPLDQHKGNVGPPVPNCMVKLVDVPEMNYFAKKQQGEICVKGPGCTPGYLYDAAKTAELIDSDGWLHTGDIGEWTEHGCLRLIDRKKHIFKLAQGEYVAPEKIEMIYSRSPYVAQIFVDGDSLQICTVAVVVPNEDTVRKLVTDCGAKWTSLANKVNNNPLTFEEICRIPEVKDNILEDLTRLGKAQGLNGVEQIKDCYISSEPFTIEGDLLTQTMKVKRPEVRKRYKAEIAKLYEAINARLAVAAAQV